MDKQIPWLQRLVVLFLILSFVAGCSSPTAAPTAAPSAVPPTTTPLPSETPLPPTATPTNTPLPPTDTPTLLPPTATETSLPTATATPTPTAATPAGGTIVPAASGSTVTIYFIQLKTGGPIACGDSAIGVSSGVKRTGDTARNVAEGLRVLFATKSKAVGSLYNPLYASNIKVDRVYLDGDLIWVYLRGTYKLPKDDCDNLRIKAQVWLTIRQFSDVKKTNIFLNNIPFGDRVSNDK